jgi:hypothetical protein
MVTHCVYKRVDVNCAYQQCVYTRIKCITSIIFKYRKITIKIALWKYCRIYNKLLFGVSNLWYGNNNVHDYFSVHVLVIDSYL